MSDRYDDDQRVLPDPTPEQPCDIWRVRIVRLDAYDDFDLEWHDDILYRDHSGEDIAIRDLWRVEIVSAATGDLKRAVRAFKSRDEAESLAASITDQSHSLSVRSFMDTYLVGI
ncbi:MAG: hypothetical protein FWC54_01570 [Actinomycetia bacterium]|nr:hypothetical protein [Actinomycetes bacterium]